MSIPRYRKTGPRAVPRFRHEYGIFLAGAVRGSLGRAEDLQAGEVGRAVVFGPRQLVRVAVVAEDQPGEALALHGGVQRVIVGPLGIVKFNANGKLSHKNP